MMRGVFYGPIVPRFFRTTRVLSRWRSFVGNGSLSCHFTFRPPAFSNLADLRLYVGAFRDDYSSTAQTSRDFADVHGHELDHRVSLGTHHYRATLIFVPLDFQTSGNLTVGSYRDDYSSSDQTSRDFADAHGYDLGYQVMMATHHYRATSIFTTMSDIMSDIGKSAKLHCQASSWTQAFRLWLSFIYLCTKATHKLESCQVPALRTSVMFTIE